MAPKSLFVKYRPSTWSELVEQDAIKQILSYELQNNQLKRVMLFTGGAGTGKTTSARIFAKEIEKEASNIYEINCADNTGVDDVRSLVIDTSRSKPIVGKYKIYILDECHMLTVQAQNSLLKLLEEPPVYCFYILCTTDPQKVLPTIMSRAVRYDFQLISHQGIMSQLEKVLNAENNGKNEYGVTSWTADALDLIATQSNGHMRDALNLLQKTISYSKEITVDSVVNVLGVTNYNVLFGMLHAIIGQNQAELLSVFDGIAKSGIDLKLFVKNFLSFVLDVNKYIILKTESPTADAMSFLNIPRNFEQYLVGYNSSHRAQLKHLLTNLIELNSSIRWETNIKPVLETNLLLEVL